MVPIKEPREIVWFRDAVFTELVQKLASEDEVEELIDLSEQRILRRCVPLGTPENGEYLHGGE